MRVSLKKMSGTVKENSGMCQAVSTKDNGNKTLPLDGKNITKGHYAVPKWRRLRRLLGLRAKIGDGEVIYKKRYFFKDGSIYDGEWVQDQ